MSKKRDYLVMNEQGLFAQLRMPGHLRMVSEYPDATKFTREAAEQWQKDTAFRSNPLHAVSVADYDAGKV